MLQIECVMCGPGGSGGRVTLLHGPAQHPVARHSRVTKSYLNPSGGSSLSPLPTPPATTAPSQPQPTDHAFVF